MLSEAAEGRSYPHVPVFNGGYKEDGEFRFTRSHRGKARADGYKLLLGTFQLDTKGKFFTKRPLSLWNNFPGEVVEFQHWTV